MTATVAPLSTDQLDTFDRDGFVLLPGALTRAEAEHFRDLITGLVPRNLDLPPHWHVAGGRIKPMFAEGNQSFFTPELIPLLVNPVLYAAACQLLGSDQLRVSDGSIGITLRNDANQDTTLSQTLHLDASVPVDQDFALTQQELQVGGCYYLTDVEPDGGGIHVVPGGHRLVEEEVRAHGPGGRQLHQNWKRITHLTSQEVTGQAGDFAMLHHLMPHAASHNRRPTSRVAFFVRFVREDQTWGQGAAPAPGTFDDDQVSAMGDLGRKLFGVEPW